MLLVSSGSYLYLIRWSHMLSWEWRCSWSSANRQCSNYIWVINNFIAYYSASYIRDLTVMWVFEWMKSVHYWWSYILFAPEWKELTCMLDPLSYRWGVPPIVIRYVHWTMQRGVLQTWITAQSPATVMVSADYFVQFSSVQFIYWKQAPVGLYFQIQCGWLLQSICWFCWFQLDSWWFTAIENMIIPVSLAFLGNAI